MRDLINLINLAEARQAAIDPQAVYARIMKVVGELSLASHIFSGKWEMDWSGEIHAGIAKAKEQHMAMEKENYEYEKEDGKEYKIVPFSIQMHLGDVTAKWWDDSVKPVLQEIIYEIKHQADEYNEWKPDVESSDQLSLFAEEQRMATSILYQGGDTLQGIMTTMTILDSYAYSLNMAQDIDYSHPCTHSTVKFVKSVFPAFLLITRLFGAKKLS